MARTKRTPKSRDAQDERDAWRRKTNRVISYYGGGVKPRDWPPREPPRNQLEQLTRRLINEFWTFGNQRVALFNKRKGGLGK